ncbi:hypothetical protein ACFVVM_07265 [Nocardia sp. NPDC058176]|uniref:5-methylcytosine restriction system specificity protein McrC n=1 Tax=Nocardia sp. NPDC058176 TaxID=3346368 RepID=UPI0036DD8C7B
MSNRIVIHDLAPLDTTPSEDERRWLEELAQDTTTSDYVIDFGQSITASTPEPVVQCGPDGIWRAGRYIGEIYRDGRVLEIRPRLGIETIAAWAGAALNVRIVPDAAEHAHSPSFVAELLAAAWRATVTSAARHGPPALRAPVRHVSPHVRGRLDLPATLALRSARSPNVVSTSRPKQLDNPISSTIVLADRVLDRALHRTGWRGQRIDELLPQLKAAVGSRPALPTQRSLARVRYTPITLPYRGAAELSWRIARHRGLLANAADHTDSGLLIDVAELWELFVLHCARRAYGSAHVTHGTRLTNSGALLHAIDNPARTLGRLYPDVVIGPLRHPWAIVDAKYKRLVDPVGVVREDLYQINAYLGTHASAPLPLGMLAYVDFPGQTAISRAEGLGPWITTIGHTVRFQRLPVTANHCIAAMQQLVPRPHLR